jgi:alkanesulfonate monooxygenase SsuD/methylene tetrahydromethanopterin reductase-like flavin-dependent oxidoreductase (luciferase family)
MQPGCGSARFGPAHRQPRAVGRYVCSSNGLCAAPREIELKRGLGTFRIERRGASNTRRRNQTMERVMDGDRRPALKFGVFDHMDDSGLPLKRHYADRLEIAAACDRAGFRAYHVSEHHGTPHGHAPSPNLFLAAVAQRTSKLRLGPMVMLLNLYHPLRAFEEICMLDQISGGRVELGIGRGAGPIEASFFGVQPEQADDLYRESVEIILKAMGADTLSHDGRHFKLDGVPITLSPFQRPHPPLWCGTTKPGTASWAAENSVNVACIGSASMIREVTGAYRARWAGTSQGEAEMPLLGMVRHVVIADTDAEAHALAAPAYERWFETLHHLPRSRGVSAPPILPASFSDAVAAGHCLTGSAATVREALIGQVREAGVTYLMCHIAFGDLPLAASLDTIAALQADVMPAFEQACARPGLISA